MSVSLLLRPFVCPPRFGKEVSSSSPAAAALLRPRLACELLLLLLLQAVVSLGMQVHESGVMMLRGVGLRVRDLPVVNYLSAVTLMVMMIRLRMRAGRVMAHRHGS